MNDRHTLLNSFIDKNFDLHPDEIDQRSLHYDHVTMIMIEIKKVSAFSAEAMDLFYDTVYSPIQISAELSFVLLAGDVFLATLGMKNQSWHFIYLSPPYETCYVDMNFNEDDEEYAP